MWLELFINQIEDFDWKENEHVLTRNTRGCELSSLNKSIVSHWLELHALL